MATLWLRAVLDTKSVSACLHNVIIVAVTPFSVSNGFGIRQSTRTVDRLGGLFVVIMADPEKVTVDKAYFDALLRRYVNARALSVYAAVADSQCAGQILYDCTVQCILMILDTDSE